jgi:hypothetical protein
MIINYLRYVIVIVYETVSYENITPAGATSRDVSAKKISIFDTDK